MKEKEVVPSREERMENIGEPKAPRMGNITPTTVDLPDVDDLLKEMGKVAPKTRKELLSINPKAVDFKKLWRKID